MVPALQQLWSPLRHDATVRMRAGAALLVLGLLAVGLLLILANPSGAAVGQRAFRIAKAASGGFSDKALRAANAEMDPAMLALALRYDPAAARSGPDASWLRRTEPAPAASALDVVTPQKAAELNDQIPFSLDPNPAARPFTMATAAAADRTRALGCLTQAIYYEAGFEPLDGQRAVAQVVINRMRHPAFPKTVCGVVFQCANLPTGCQFSFTCDGALAREPVAAAWARAEKVAAAALAGYVMPAVGGATHYHADYVSPYWAPRLFKVSKVGAHIFYRWPGSWGLPPAFSGRYAGNEKPGVDLGGNPLLIDLATLTMAGLEGAADAYQQAARDSAVLALAANAVVERAPAATIATPVIAPAAPPEPETAAAPLPMVHITRPARVPPRLAIPD